MGDDTAFDGVTEKGDLPTRPEAEVSLVEISEQEDRLEILYGERRDRRKTMAWLAAVAGVFFVWGILYGPPGYIIAVILTVFQIVPVARHVVVSEEIRRAERELDRLLLARGVTGDSGSDSDGPAGGGDDTPTGGQDDTTPGERLHPDRTPPGGHSDADPDRDP